MTPRFLIAKYIPELSRLEPRNIGVIVWVPGHVSMKFIDPNQAPFLKDLTGFRACVSEWMEQASQPQVKIPGRQPVDKSDREYLTEFRRLEEPAFMMMDAGDVLENVKPAELPEVTDFLFDRLVSLTRKDERMKAERNSLRKECRDLFNETGFGEMVTAHFETEGSVYGVTKKMKFSYGVGDGRPEAVFQLVHLEKDASVNDAAVRLHSVESILEQDFRAAIIKSDTDNYPTTNRSIIEGCAGTIIDLSNRSMALETIHWILSRI